MDPSLTTAERLAQVTSDLDKAAVAAKLANAKRARLAAEQRALKAELENELLRAELAELWREKQITVDEGIERLQRQQDNGKPPDAPTAVSRPRRSSGKAMAQPSISGGIADTATPEPSSGPSSNTAA